MRVLVTGATGFVGRAVVAEFDSRGIEYVAVGGRNPPAGYYSVDVGDNGSWKALDVDGKVDAVVHLAELLIGLGR